LDDRRLLFDADSRVLVLSCSLRLNRVKFPQVYFRNLDEETYHSLAERVAEHLGELPGSLSLDTPILSTGKGIFSIISRYDKPDLEQQIPIHVLGIAMLKLPTLSLDIWPTPTNVDERWFPIELIGSDPSTDSVHAIVGMPPKQVPGPVCYSVAELRWHERAVRMVASARCPYF
jgi:hypothetical protein